MANFCRDCSIDLFGKDFGDLAGITTKRETELGRYYFAICEGCGHVMVDHEGVVVERLMEKSFDPVAVSGLPNDTEIPMDQDFLDELMALGLEEDPDIPF